MTPVLSGPISTVRQAVRAERMLWAFCLQCGHAAHMNPWELAKVLGQDMPLQEAAARCRCTRCRALDTVIFPSRRAMPAPIKR